MFRRKIMAELEAWKNSSGKKKALVIKGLRQIGKTYSVREFAKENYKNVVYVNFKENESAKKIFDYDLNVNRIIIDLSALIPNSRFEEGNTVIIFDEIQECANARSSIKPFCEDGRFDIIATGSLLGIKGYNKKKGKGVPTGFERVVYMKPMDFEEFLWATGDNVTAPFIKDCFEKRIPMGDKLHRKIMTTFRTYFAIGGMPQVIEAFVQGKNYQEIDMIKRNILSLYEEDLAKYDDENHEKATAIFKAIPEQLSNHNSKFKFSKIDENARYRNYIYSVKCIAESMIGNYCRNITNPQITLDLFAESDNFKLFMGDTGLLVTQILRTSNTVQEDLYRKIITGHLGANLGMIFENMVAQMLRARGYELFFHEYYYTPEGKKTEQRYEVDFLIVKNGHLCPIEVKSSAYKNHESFDYYVEKYNPKKHDRFIIYTKDLAQDNDIIFIPIYMTMCL